MRKLRHLFTTALVALTLLLWGNVGLGQGLEDFTNSNATTGYANGSFVGNNGITWTYVASRDDNGDANKSGIVVPALMLRRVADNSSVTSSTIPGGIGNFSVKLYKGFTGNGDRQVELFINGISKGISTPFNDFDEHIFVVNDINIEGDIVISIKNITSTQVIIDDITWTGYTAGPDTEAPVPTFLPANEATGVALDIHPTITFNEAIYTAPDVLVVDTHLASLVTFKTGGEVVAHTATITGNVITVVPTANLEYEKVYTLTVGIVQDKVGNVMDAEASATFTTISATAPTIELTGTYPGPFYAGEETTVTWNATYMDNVVVEAWVPSESAWLPMSSVPIAATLGTYTFTIPADAHYSANYKLRVANAVGGTPSAESNEFKVREVHTTLATLRARPANTEARFDGTAIVTYSRDARHQKYIQDNNAAILIDDATGIITQAYPIGSAITGLVGKISVFSNLVQFLPLADPGAPASVDNPVVPFVATLAGLTSADQSKLIKLENITFTSTGDFAAAKNYDLKDNNGVTFRTNFAESDYIGKAIPTQNIVEMVALVGQNNADIQLTSRSTADWSMLSSVTTLSTFTLGGKNAIELTGLLTDDGATLFVDDFTGFAGIVATATDAKATVEVKLNGAVVEEANLAAQALVDKDVVVVAVTAEDGTVANYKVTLSGENRELALTAPTGVNTYNTAEDIVFTWTSANIENVNIYAVDATKAENLINKEPIVATAGTYTYKVANGVFGTYKFRITDATDATFFSETVELNTVTDNAMPLPKAFYPYPGAENVPTSFTFMAEFDEAVKMGTGNLTIHKSSDKTVVVTITPADVTVADKVITATVSGLDWGTAYYVNITAGMVQDLSGNELIGITDETMTFTTVAEPASDLFFSEYIEGSGNSKAIEIYNPTGASVDLSKYILKKGSNGADFSTELALTGTLAEKGVFVIVHESADAQILAVKDLVDAGGKIVYFNGNDAVGLFKNGVLIDVIGTTTGIDPVAWDVAGVAKATLDHTLVRKNTVTYGNTNWAASAGTNVDNSEWVVHPVNTFNFLGRHGANDEVEILTFKAENQMAPATINATAKTITLQVLNGTALTAIKPEFKLSFGATATVGGIVQQSGVTEVDFTAPVEYTVTAENGTDIKVWTVTITEAPISTLAEIASFTIVGQMGPAAINSDAKTVEITVEPATAINAVEPIITISLGATINPASGVVQDFANPVEYTVTAQDGTTTKVWTVTVTVATIITIKDIQYTPSPEGASPKAGKIVVTKGIVTAHHYKYEGGAYQGFFIQDGKGAWNGLYVFNELLAVADRPKVKDEVEVSGKVEEYFKLTELTTGGGTVTMNIKVLSSDNDLPEPEVLTTTQAAKEEWEGVLISVKKAKYTIANDGFGVFGFTDGSGPIYTDDDMYDYVKAGTFELNKSYNITGIGHYSYDHAKILPRYAEDIELLTGIATVWGESIVTYPNPFTNTLYVDNVENASRVVIVNLIGQQVINVNLNGTNRTEISTNDLPAGVYLVSIVNNQGQKVVRKMIKR